jgi:cytochrome P450 family 103
MNSSAADPDDNKPEPASVAVDELERDPHGVFRRYRKQFPFIRRADGTALVLRNKDVQQLFADPRTRQSETEFASHPYGQIP